MVSGRAWPWPGDSELVRARRVALAYRGRLTEADPVLCGALDEQMKRWGQNWAVAELITFDLDDWLTPRQAADLASVRVHRIAALRRNGRLPGRRTTEGRWEFQARDVLALSAEPRSRKRGEGEADDDT